MRIDDLIMVKKLLITFFLTLVVTSIIFQSNIINFFNIKTLDTETVPIKEEVNFLRNEIIEKISGLTTVRQEVGVDKLFALGYNGTGVTIGIVDSGVNSMYPDDPEKNTADQYHRDLYLQ